MFVVILTYKTSIEIVDKHVVEHRAFLERCYKQNFFIASGPQKPRSGGILISQLKSREQLEELLKEDPFAIHQIADYNIIEFEPIKYHPNFLSFID